MSLARNIRDDPHNISANVLVRINGTIPEVSTLGDEKKSERAAEVKQKEIITNTSCSIFSITSPPSQGKDEEIFHLLIDAGEGVVKSIEKGITDSVSSQRRQVSLSKMPNAILITHSHDDHINDLPKLIDKVKDGSDKINVYCTKECRDLENKSIGNVIEVEGLQKYTFKIEKDDKEHKLSFPFIGVLLSSFLTSPIGISIISL